MARETNPHLQPDGWSPAPERAPRPRSGRLLAFDLAEESAALREESPWLEHGRNAVTLVKYPDLRVVQMVLASSAKLEEHHTGATITILLLRGRARLHAGADVVDMGPRHLVSVERDVPHELEALEECEILLTLAWREARTLPDPTAESATPPETRGSR